MKDRAYIIPPDNIPHMSAGTISAAQFEEFISRNPEILPHVKLKHPENGMPLVFKASHKRNGNLESISVHFAYASGYAPHEDHIFKSGKVNKNLEQAVADGDKILLSMNLDTSYQALDFSDDQDSAIQSERKWKRDNRDYHIVSVKNVTDIIQLIKKVNELGGDLKNNMSVLYRGAVMPYPDFYLGKRKNDIANLYEDMTDNRSGIRIGETRSLGFPRVMRMELTQSTLKEFGVKGIKGNLIKTSSRAILNQLIFSAENSLDKRLQLQKAWEKVKLGQGEIYVVASPTISLKSEDKTRYWNHMRWVINDADIQITPMRNPERLAVMAVKFQRQATLG